MCWAQSPQIGSAPKRAPPRHWTMPRHRTAHQPANPASTTAVARFDPAHSRSPATSAWPMPPTAGRRRNEAMPSGQRTIEAMSPAPATTRTTIGPKPAAFAAMSIASAAATIPSGAPKAICSKRSNPSPDRRSAATPGAENAARSATAATAPVMGKLRKYSSDPDSDELRLFCLARAHRMTTRTCVVMRLRAITGLPAQLKHTVLTRLCQNLAGNRADGADSRNRRDDGRRKHEPFFATIEGHDKGRRLSAIFGSSFVAIPGAARVVDEARRGSRRLSPTAGAAR